MGKKSVHFLVAVITAILFGACMVPSVFAHSIDYIATDIQPQAIFSGQSGHFRLVDPIGPGETITFNLTLELILSAGGSTTAFPATATFGVKNTGGGYDPSLVRFGTPNTTLTDIVTYTYDRTKTNSFMTPVTAYAPMAPGSYHFKIQTIEGFQGRGFTPGDGIVIHFKVEDPTVPAVIPTNLEVSLQTPSIIYKAPSSVLEAKLIRTDTGAGVSGQTIVFSVEGGTYSATTNTAGVAVYSYNPAHLRVGDYTVAADFYAANGYGASSGSATQCITYDWLGFQPPVAVQSSTTSGLGIGLFQGKVIPVKVKIADYYKAPVPDATDLQVFYAKTFTNLPEDTAVAIQSTIADAGNYMRYDAASDQYILNWNISGLTNGDYNIRVGTEEGGCVTSHWNPVRIGKATK